MAQTPEGKVKDAVKKALRKYGIWFYMPVQNGMGVTGIPDFICCWHGEFIGIETKAPGKINMLTPNQERVRDEIQKQHGWHFTVDNVADLEQYLTAVQTYIRITKGVRHAEVLETKAGVQHEVPVVTRAGEETGDAQSSPGGSDEGGAGRER